jgi:hypothetical protein
MSADQLGKGRLVSVGGKLPKQVGVICHGFLQYYCRSAKKRTRDGPGASWVLNNSLKAARV